MTLSRVEVDTGWSFWRLLESIPARVLADMREPLPPI
jgi:hypothetical protein